MSCQLYINNLDYYQLLVKYKIDQNKRNREKKLYKKLAIFDFLLIIKQLIKNFSLHY